jgi:lipoyl(octanoyl) transferase
MAYGSALECQNRAFDSLLRAKAAGAKGSDWLFFCEHLPVLTIGKSGDDSNLLVSEASLADRGVELYRVNRGGDVTFHGPGQITAYPIFDLERRKIGLRQYVYNLEEVVIRFLESYGVKAARRDDARGVWIDVATPWERKICAVGVKSSRYVTMHGLAVNINTDLSYFSLINPCGFVDCGVTSLERELGGVQDIKIAKWRLLSSFEDVFPPLWDE